MERTELVEHMIEQHGITPTLRERERTMDEEELWAGHNGLHLKGRALVDHGHGEPEPSCPPPQLVE